MARVPSTSRQRSADLKSAEAERSLDPENWDEFRRIAHRALDAAIDHIADARSRPVWRPIPDAVKSALTSQELPLGGVDPEQLVEEITQSLAPYTCGNTHPRFFGWVHGTGTAGGIVAEMMAAAINANLGGRDHAPVYLERQVIEWCRQMFDLPEGAGGLLVSGTSMATLIALTIARNTASKEIGDVRRHGLQTLERRLVAYTSSEAHGSVVKALEMIGVGREWVRAIPVNAAFQMDVSALAKAIAGDRDQGHHPFAVIATAGTVNTAAIDPIDAIADLCDDEKIWLHVDGAFGGLGVLSPKIKPGLAGIQRADSIAFDFHKWLHVPYDAGCVLVRRQDLQLETFSQRPPYLAGMERGLAAGEPWFCEMGPELSRGFRALKVWFTLKEHGLERLGEKIAENCAQARYLATRIEQLDGFELAAPVSLNIACFRVVPPGLGPTELDKLNADIVVALQERGIAAPSTTRIGKRTVIRVNITNHRTTIADIDMLIDAVRELAHDFSFGQSTVARVAARPERGADQLAIDDDRRFRRLAAVLARPDIAPLVDGIEVGLAVELKQPFLVLDARRVQIGRAVLDTPDAAASAVRHALEIAHWIGAFGDKIREPAYAAAAALLGARCGALHLSALPEDAKTTAYQVLPEFLRDAYGRLSKALLWTDLRELFMPGAGLVAGLLGLQSGGLSHIVAVSASAAVKADAADLVLRLAAIAVPAEVLLSRGGDSRVAPVEGTGRNAYRTSTMPQPKELCFSSSTATNVSTDAYSEVERLRQKLITAGVAGNLDHAFRRQMASVRREVTRITGAAKVEGSAVILTASGTDTELVAFDFARAGEDGKAKKSLVSIVIDPNETGSGVPLAAAGRHYLSQTSQGNAVTAGQLIDAPGGDGVIVQTVGLREIDGTPRPAPTIDIEVEDIVEQAIAAGKRCLLHVLDASKTGLGAPSIGLARRLKQRHEERLDVVVDACQMRLGTAAMQAYLELGFMLQVTASKFYTAPPFAGALVLPRAIARRQRSVLPRGLAAYIGAAEWPSVLERRLHVPAGRPNFGLLARWTAALHEIHAFEKIPAGGSLDLLRRFESDVAALIGKRSSLRLVAAPAFDRSALGVAHDGWADLATIFPFAVLRAEPDGSRTPLSFEDLRDVYRLMTEDVTARLPAGTRCDPRTASTPCHLGQPVRIANKPGAACAVLRLCASARHVVDVFASGSDPEMRYRELLANVELALDKVCLIGEALEALRKPLSYGG